MSVKGELLIPKENIKEELKLIRDSINTYVSPNGNIYSYHEYIKHKGYLKHSLFINSRNGYVYCTVNYPNKGTITRRLHILVAEAYVSNPNLDKYKLVGHKDNDKTNDIYTNLYWTNNQDNVNKAIEDGLNVTKKGIDNKDSKCLKVTDLNNKLVSVYGSFREAERCVENLDLTYISKVSKNNGNYKPRNKKYKYIEISKEEYENTDGYLKGLKLCELPKQSKQPSVFKAINIITCEELISDNQKQFAKEHNLQQPMVSHAIQEGAIYGNFKFERIKKISYADSSAYENLINLTDNIVIKNIKTNEIKEFKTVVELKRYFNLTGNDIKQYINRNNLIFSEWKIISYK